ncbi:MAG: oligosaccharide flippase family protein [Thermoleophilia bacterium]
MSETPLEDEPSGPDRPDRAPPKQLGVKALAQDAAIYGGARVLLKSLAFLLVPLYAHFLTTEEFGDLDTVLATVAFVDVFLTANMDGVFARFYFDRDEARWRRQIITTYLLIETLYPAVIVGTLIGLSGFLSDRILGTEELATFFVLALIDVYLTNVVDLPMILCRLRRKPLTFAAYSLSRGLIQIVFSVLLVAVWQLGVKGILIASLIAVCAAFVFTLREYVRDLVREIPWRVAKEMISFAWPGIIGGASFYGLGLFDRFVVRHYHGADDVGLYGAAYRYAQIVVVAVFAFRLGWTQWHYSWFKTDRHPAMVARGATYYFVATGLLAVTVAAWISPVFHLIMPDRFLPSTEAVAPLCLAAVGTGAYTLFAVGLNVTKRMRLLAPMAALGSGIAIGLYFALVPPFSFVGAAWATVGGFAALSGLVLLVSNRIYPVPWHWRRILTVLGTTFGLALASLAVDAWVDLAWSIPLRIAITLAFPLGLWAMRVFPPADLAAMGALARRLRR